MNVCRIPLVLALKCSEYATKARHSVKAKRLERNISARNSQLALCKTMKLQYKQKQYIRKSFVSCVQSRM